MKVALVPLVFDHSADVPFVVPKAMLSHGLAFLLAGILVALLLRHGRGVLVLSQLHLPVAAFLLVNIAAAIFAVDPRLALYGTHARMLGLATTLDLAVLYFAVAFLMRTRADMLALLFAMTLATATVVAYEAVQLTHKDPFQWSTDTAERPFSTFGQANTLAYYLTVVAVGASAIALLADRLRLAPRIFMFVYVGVLLVGAAATGTRSSLIGLAAGSTVLVVLVWMVHPSRRARLFSVFGAASAVAVMVGLLLFSPLGQRVATIIEDSQNGDPDEQILDRLEPSTAGRLALYEIALQALRERPILGYGPDNFIVAVPRYRAEQEQAYIRRSLASSAHSWLTHVGTSSGVLGLASFAGIIAVAFSLVLRSQFRPTNLVAAAALAAFLGTGLTTVNELGTEWLSWLCFGLIATKPPPGSEESSRTGHASAPVRGYRRRSQSQLRRVLVPLVGVASVLLTLGGVVAWDASRLIRESAQSRLAGRPSQAIDLGLQATRSDPGRALYWHSLALAYIAGGRWRDATLAFDRASALTPYDVRYIGDSARAQLLLASTGETSARAKAVELADTAVRVDPNNPLSHQTRAVVFQSVGNVPEALRSAERALALDPGSTDPTLYVTATQLLSSSGRTGDAIRVARDGVAELGQTAASVPVRIELARALSVGGQFREALTEIDLALAIQPNDPVARRVRAEIQAQLSK